MSIEIQPNVILMHAWKAKQKRKKRLAHREEMKRRKERFIAHMKIIEQNKSAQEASVTDFDICDIRTTIDT